MLNYLCEVVSSPVVYGLPVIESTTNKISVFETIFHKPTTNVSTPLREILDTEFNSKFALNKFIIECGYKVTKKWRPQLENNEDLGQFKLSRWQISTTDDIPIMDIGILNGDTGDLKYVVKIMSNSWSFKNRIGGNKHEAHF